MKRLFRLQATRDSKKKWFAVAEHFPAAQKVSVKQGIANKKDDVSFVGDQTEEYIKLKFKGLKELLRDKKVGDCVVDVETQLGKEVVRKFVPVIAETKPAEAKPGIAMVNRTKPLRDQYGRFVTNSAAEFMKQL